MDLSFVEMMPLASLIVDEALRIHPGENAVIVTDSRVGRYPGAGQIIKALAAALAERGIEFNVVTFRARNVRGDSIPVPTLDILRNADAAVLLVSQSYLYTASWHTVMRGKNKARMITLPPAEDAKGTDNLFYKLPKTKEDFYSVAEVGEKLAKVLSPGKHIARVTAANGTDVTFSMNDLSRMIGTGKAVEPGTFSGLPAGGCSVGIGGGDACGTIVFDRRFNLFKQRYLADPIILRVDQGRIFDISGGSEARQFESYVDALPYDREKILNVAEFGLGFNPLASMDGVDAGEWELVLGAAHFGIGADAGFGGSVAVPFHEDGMIENASVEIDGVMITDNGRFLI